MVEVLGKRTSSSLHGIDKITYVNLEICSYSDAAAELPELPALFSVMMGKVEIEHLRGMVRPHTRSPRAPTSVSGARCGPVSGHRSVSIHTSTQYLIFSPPLPLAFASSCGIVADSRTIKHIGEVVDMFIALD